jgi:hypothetical protein
MTEQSSAPNAAPSFDAHIRPLFRSKDRNSMLSRFDLWSYDDVHAHQDRILAAIRGGSMPCDGAWPAADVATLERWIEAGSAP